MFLSRQLGEVMKAFQSIDSEHAESHLWRSKSCRIYAIIMEKFSGLFVDEDNADLWQSLHCLTPEEEMAQLHLGASLATAQDVLLDALNAAAGNDVIVVLDKLGETSRQYVQLCRLTQLTGLGYPSSVTSLSQAFLAVAENCCMHARVEETKGLLQEFLRQVDARWLKCSVLKGSPALTA